MAADGNIVDMEALEVIEGLLQLCADREKEIAELTFELGKFKRDHKGQTEEKPEPAGTDEARITRRDIIVADGIKMQRADIIQILTRENFEIVGSTGNGQEAVKLFKEKKPALIMIDAHIPEIDGFQATKKIKEFDPDAKIIILSRSRDRQMVFEAIHAGASDYICKPFEPRRLIESTRRLLTG